MRHSWALLMILLAACVPTDAPPVRIVGHAGMGTGHALAPNSRESLLAALALGIDGVELDVQFTSDSVLVAFHDANLSISTSCSGLVNGRRWSELKACTYKDRDHSGSFIARLDSLLIEAAAQHPNAEFTLDCKLFSQGHWWGYLEAYTDALVRMEALPGLEGRILVECQVDPFLLLLQTKSVTIPLFRYDEDADHAIRRAVASHFAGITVHHARVTEEQVRHAQGLGLEVAVYGTGGRLGHWRALRKHPDRLQTDAPELLAP
jgi:glycerophosphoryl diester phosphodiesterase